MIEYCRWKITSFGFPKVKWLQNTGEMGKFTSYWCAYRFLYFLHLLCDIVSVVYDSVIIVTTLIIYYCAMISHQTPQPDFSKNSAGRNIFSADIRLSRIFAEATEFGWKYTRTPQIRPTRQTNWDNQIQSIRSTTKEFEVLTHAH